MGPAACTGGRGQVPGREQPGHKPEGSCLPREWVAPALLRRCGTTVRDVCSGAGLLGLDPGSAASQLCYLRHSFNSSEPWFSRLQNECNNISYLIGSLCRLNE